MRNAPFSIVTLETNSRAVAPALRGAEIGAALGEAPDDLARAEVEARPLGARELVAARLQAGRRLDRHVVLDPDRLVELVHAPARAVDCRLRVLAVIDDAREDLHMALRLHGAAHQAEGRDRFAVLGDEGRDDRMERPLLRPDLVGMALGRDEAGSAILQRNAGARYDDARAEAGVVRLD